MKWELSSKNNLAKLAQETSENLNTPIANK